MRAGRACLRERFLVFGGRRGPLPAAGRVSQTDKGSRLRVRARAEAISSKCRRPRLAKCEVRRGWGCTGGSVEKGPGARGASRRPGQAGGSWPAEDGVDTGPARAEAKREATSRRRDGGSSLAPRAGGWPPCPALPWASGPRTWPAGRGKPEASAVFSRDAFGLPTSRVSPLPRSADSPLAWLSWACSSAVA